MDSVKPNFSSAHEELLEDAVSIEDIDEVLEKLATAGITGTETDEPAIGESSSSAARPEDEEGENTEDERESGGHAWSPALRDRGSVPGA